MREAEMLGAEVVLLTVTSRLLLMCYRDLNVICVISLRESSTRSS